MPKVWQLEWVLLVLLCMTMDMLGTTTTPAWERGYITRLCFPIVFLGAARLTFHIQCAAALFPVCQENKLGVASLQDVG